MSHCAVDGCRNTVLCKGLCSSHYQKRRMYGTTDGNPVVPTFHVDDQGYMSMRVNGKRIRQHVDIAEKALGHKLQKGAVVHHANGVKTDNQNANLVVCQSEAYHQLLHRRQRAYDATGDASKRQCVFCKGWGREPEVTVNRANSSAFHASCRNEARRSIYATRKEVK